MTVHDFKDLWCFHTSTVVRRMYSACRLPLLTRGTVSLVDNVAIVIFLLALGKLESHNKGHIGSYQCWAISDQFGCHSSSCKKQNWSSQH